MVHLKRSPLGEIGTLDISWIATVSLGQSNPTKEKETATIVLACILGGLTTTGTFSSMNLGLTASVQVPGGAVPVGTQATYQSYNFGVSVQNLICKQKTQA